MGFRGLVPVDDKKVSAFYNAVTQELTLHAEGSVQEFTYGFDFVRDPWVGGLKFSLYGWTGPLTSKSQEYTWTQTFHVGFLPGPADVIFVTANNQNGLPVPLRVRGFGISPAKQTNGSAEVATEEVSGLSSTEGKAVPTLAGPAQEKISALFKEAFNIKHAAAVPSMGSITMKHDPRFLVVTNAGIQDNQIVWTFNSLETGNTQVILTISGGIATFVMEVVYDVRIFVLDSVPLPSAQVESNATETGGPGSILSYLGRVNIANRIVTEQYPDAKLYIATASTLDWQGVSSPYALGQMKVLFTSQKDGFITINSNGYGTYSAPHKSAITIGSANITWPVDMDAQEADKILKAEGHKGNYKTLTLRQPLYPGVKAPFYEFGMVDGDTYSVDTAKKALATN